MSYYVASAPDTLNEKQVGQKPTADGNGLFTVHTPANTYNTPATTLVSVVNTTPSNGFLINDATKQSLYKYDGQLNKVDSILTRGATVDVEWQSNHWLSCDIGVLNPNNGKYGYARYLTTNKQGKLEQEGNNLFDGLQRPVQVSAADFNADGKPDYLVCEFGYLTGALSWMENNGNGKFDRHVLRPLPGAIKAYINDYNHDGLPDIWVLFSQGEEGIFLYTNKGNGRFDQREVLRFPPVYGSSYFEFADFNKDGFPDIVYTCGDNADYSPVLKPYHGVYIFLNDGKNNFSQKYFFHINGCYKAIARDFDSDGDLDIATISFFADYKTKPEEGFVYLENIGGFQFNPFSITETQKGRWLTMDAGDINGDGKTDLILGNFSVGPALMKSKFDWKKRPPFLVLLNSGKKRS